MVSEDVTRFADIGAARGGVGPQLLEMRWKNERFQPISLRYTVFFTTILHTVTVLLLISCRVLLTAVHRFLASERLPNRTA